MTSLRAKYAEFRRKHAPKPVHGVWREVLAEFAGTFMLIFFGCSSVAQAVLGTRTGELLKRADILSINLGFALGALMAIFLAGETSGAHLNPAITLTMVVMRRLPAWKFLYYATAQLLGAFFGAMGVYTVYHDGIMNSFPDFARGKVDNVRAVGAGIFATYPGPHLGRFNGFVEQVCATGVLSMLVLAITDRKNMGIPKEIDDAAQPAYTISKRFLEALSISLLVLAIGVSQHLNSGYAINPARDLGPRLFTFCAGWGRKVFSEGNPVHVIPTKRFSYWFWIPVVGPMVGGLLGAAVYHLFIGLHLSEPRPGGREPSVVEDISDDQAQPGEAAVDATP